MIADNGNSTLEDLRTAYLASLADKKQTLGDAVAARDLVTIARLGHQLKGSGRSYGFDDVSQIGGRIEEAAQQRSLLAVQRLQKEFESLVDSLGKHHHPPSNS